jgi:hypothetical protein
VCPEVVKFTCHDFIHFSFCTAVMSQDVHQVDQSSEKMENVTCTCLTRERALHESHFLQTLACFLPGSELSEENL